MGPIEAACFERAKAAKMALYGDCGPARIPAEPVIAFERAEPPKEYEYRATHPSESWVAAMRGPDQVQTLRNRIKAMADAKYIMVEDIIRAVCLFSELPRCELISERRSKHIVRPRQIGMFLAKWLTGRSFPDIGRRFGNRDHTTVLHAIRSVEKRISDDPSVIYEVNAVLDNLNG